MPQPRSKLSIDELQSKLEAERSRVKELEENHNNLLTEFNKRTALLENELTSRFRVEENLERQQTFLRQIIDINPNFIFAKNRAGEFTLVNNALAAAFGTTAEDIIGKTDADLNPNKAEVAHFRKDDLNVLDSLVELVIPEEELTDVNGNIRYLKTVKRPLLDEEGNASHILGVASDITQLKRNEKKLEHFAAIIESTNDAVASISCEGIITSWNRSAAKMFGYSAKEAIGRHVSFICPVELIGQDESFLRRILNGEKIEGVQTQRLRRDGSIVHVHLTISPVFDSKGTLTGTSAIARDISKRIANERELQLHREELSRLVDEKTKELTESQERLRNAERLAAMGALAAGIAHEINSPIGAILLTAENSLNSSEESNSLKELKKIVKKANRKIINNANRCSLIVKEALKYSRKKETQKWPNSLNSIIRNAQHLVQQHAYARNSRIILELNESIPKMSLNPIEIEQLLVNLIKNAVDSSDNVVTVTVTTDLSRTGHITLQISDDGPGIPEDETSRIFEPFYTTRISQGGTGLGLSIVKQIVKSHSGSIQVESKMGCGTRFNISFPLHPEDLYGSNAKGSHL